MVCSTGAGSARPVVSSTTRRNVARPLSRSRSSFSSASTRSPRSVQHRQPLCSSTMPSPIVLDQQMVEADLAEFVDDDGGVGERRIVSRRLSSEVLPAPRKPVSTVSGIGSAGPRGRGRVVAAMRPGHGGRRARLALPAVGSAAEPVARLSAWPTGFAAGFASASASRRRRVLAALRACGAVSELRGSGLAAASSRLGLPPFGLRAAPALASSRFGFGRRRCRRRSLRACGSCRLGLAAAPASAASVAGRRCRAYRRCRYRRAPARLRPAHPAGSEPRLGLGGAGSTGNRIGRVGARVGGGDARPRPRRPAACGARRTSRRAGWAARRRPAASTRPCRARASARTAPLSLLKPRSRSCAAFIARAAEDGAPSTTAISRLPSRRRRGDQIEAGGADEAGLHAVGARIAADQRIVVAHAPACPILDAGQAPVVVVFREIRG